MTKDEHGKKPPNSIYNKKNHDILKIAYYDKGRFLDDSILDELIEATGLTDEQIKAWFKHRRSDERRKHLIVHRVPAPHLPPTPDIQFRSREPPKPPTPEPVDQSLLSKIPEFEWTPERERTAIMLALSMYAYIFLNLFAWFFDINFYQLLFG